MQPFGFVFVSHFIKRRLCDSTGYTESNGKIILGDKHEGRVKNKEQQDINPFLWQKLELNSTRKGTLEFKPTKHYIRRFLCPSKQQYI
jgi:hypothetical protein